MTPHRALGDELHVWWLDLEPPVARLRELEAFLDDDERTTALCFVSDRHRTRFTAGRGAVREILAGYLGRDPRGLRFERGPFGKPRLADQAVQFNFSHSEARGVLAVAREGRIGVDVEHVRDWRDLRELEALCFTRSERRELERLSDDARLRAFFRLWTRKEALLKAAGVGLSRPLTELEVGLDSGRAVSEDERFILMHLPEESDPRSPVSLATDRSPGLVRVHREGTWKTLPGAARDVRVGSCPFPKKWS